MPASVYTRVWYVPWRDERSRMFTKHGLSYVSYGGDGFASASMAVYYKVRVSQHGIRRFLDTWDNPEWLVDDS